MIENKINLVFNEEKHEYRNGDTDKLFISATTLIHKYEEDFNTEFWGMFTALKNANMKPVPKEKSNQIKINNSWCNVNELYNNSLYNDLAERVKEDWIKKTKKSHVRGNKVHDYLEDSINESRGDKEGRDNSLITPLSSLTGNSKLTSSYIDKNGLVHLKSKNDLDETDLQETYPEIYKSLLSYINAGCTIIAEKKVYTSKYMVAGMIDVLVIKGKHFAIIDWKTNKDEMMFISGYYKKVKQGDIWVRGNEFIERNDTLSIPLNKVPRCKGMIYSLQLSLYAYIMEECWGYKLVKDGLTIFHFRPNRKPKKIKIRYMKKDIHNMLEHYKNSNREADYPVSPNEAFKKTNKSKFGIR